MAKNKTIPQSEWKWFGVAAHFICGTECRFHLATQVGEYLISTVGEYFPDAPVRELLAAQRCITLEGRGDNRRHDYMIKIGFEKIGSDRLYETMVFKAGEPCKREDCNCGLPEISGSELDFNGYNVRGEATAGHYAMCDKYSKL